MDRHIKKQKNVAPLLPGQQTRICAEREALRTHGPRPRKSCAVSSRDASRNDYRARARPHHKGLKAIRRKADSTVPATVCAGGVRGEAMRGILPGCAPFPPRAAAALPVAVRREGHLRDESSSLVLQARPSVHREAHHPKPRAGRKNDTELLAIPPVPAERVIHVVEKLPLAETREPAPAEPFPWVDHVLLAAGYSRSIPARRRGEEREGESPLCAYPSMPRSQASTTAGIRSPG
jgi:hypothetical protein